MENIQGGLSGFENIQSGSSGFVPAHDGSSGFENIQGGSSGFEYHTNQYTLVFVAISLRTNLVPNAHCPLVI